MATSVMHDLFDGGTYHLMADSTEFFRMKLLNAETKEPIDLSTATNVEWFVGSASTRNRYAEVTKSLLNDEIYILSDAETGAENIVQVSLKGDETKNFSGGFIHQLLVTDGDGNRFRPMQGLLVFSSALISIN